MSTVPFLLPALMGRVSRTAPWAEDLADHCGQAHHWWRDLGLDSIDTETGSCRAQLDGLQAMMEDIDRPCNLDGQPVDEPSKNRSRAGALASVKVNGRVYRTFTSHKCKVCSTPRRREIEELLVAGHSGGHVVRALGLEEEGLSPRNLTDHLRAHVPVADATMNQFRDQLACERGAPIEGAVNRFVAHVGFARRVLAMVEERLKSGDAQPTIRDGIAAAKLLAGFDLDSGSMAPEVVKAAFTAYIDETKKLMTPEQFAAFGEALHNSQQLRRLNEVVMERRAGRDIPMPRPGNPVDEPTLHTRTGG